MTIVKGFMNEPVALKSVNYDKKVVTLLGRSGKTSISLKDKYVFCYDKSLYGKLQEAFALNDTERLAKEWQKAKPISSVNFSTITKNN
jgi:hypothetical protein